MKKIVLALILVVFAVATAHAQSGSYVTTTAARVRSCPNTTCEVVRSLARNTTVTVVGSADGSAFNGSTLWYQLDGGGFIHSSLVRPASPSSGGTSPSTSDSPAPTCPSPRPRNCEQAVATGADAVTIARCFPNLDRDKDGLACYGH